MFRVIINIVGIENSPWLDFETQDLADDYISEVMNSQHWGKNAYEIQIGFNDDVSPYSSTRIESQYIIHNLDGTTTTQTVSSLPPQGTALEDIVYQRKFGTVPAQVTFEKVDVTTEYNQRTLDQYTLDQVALADSQVSTLLQGFDKTTQLSDCMAAMYVYFNVPGTFTTDQINQAKVTLDSNYTLYSEAKAIQSQMYQNIAAKKTSLGL